MADLLLELYSEEIPAGFQARAGEDLARLVTEALLAQGVARTAIGTPTSYAAPQRLALTIDALPPRTADSQAEKKGPRVDAPKKAIDGFLRANGLDSTDSLTRRDDPKGAYYVLEVKSQGREMAEILAVILPEIIQSFPWPKSMRWEGERLRWVRPLRGILCRFDGAVVPFSLADIRADGTSFGHRFLAPAALEIKHASDYVAALRAAKVMVCAKARRAHISEAAAKLAAKHGAQCVDDAALLAEIAGLVEWPIVLLGKIDAEFMELPQEVLISVMRKHQKYIALRDKKTDQLAPYFILVANMETADGGAAIIAGNERVLRARLSDAQFFWQQDRKVKLETRAPALGDIIFHQKLGSLAEKAQRIATLAAQLAPHFAVNAKQATTAAQLCKADLTCGMVAEFPELQGVMGGYYAKNDGLAAEVAAAIAEHYAPLGARDDLPQSALGQLVALADKLDTLAGFWCIDEKPTGSKDPYALRRAALGVIRILEQARPELTLMELVRAALAVQAGDAAADDLAGFIAARLEVLLRAEGKPVDVVRALMHRLDQPLHSLTARAELLSAFVVSPDGGNLLAAYRRADGILGAQADGVIDEQLLTMPEEQALVAALQNLPEMAGDDIAAYQAYLAALAALRAPVDAFFDHVHVNDDDAARGRNRHNILRHLCDQMERVGKLSLLEKS